MNAATNTMTMTNAVSAALMRRYVSTEKVLAGRESGRRRGCLQKPCTFDENLPIMKVAQEILCGSQGPDCRRRPLRSCLCYELSRVAELLQSFSRHFVRHC